MIATKLHAGPQMGERRIDPQGEEWEIIGLAQIIEDDILLIERVKDRAREYMLDSKFNKWRPVE